eukprot:86875-Chlamydomonas_euryale.AAC.3
MKKVALSCIWLLMLGSKFSQAQPPPQSPITTITKATTLDSFSGRLQSPATPNVHACVMPHPARATPGACVMPYPARATPGACVMP